MALEKSTDERCHVFRVLAWSLGVSYMRIFRIIALILGSAWFLPVSCAIGVIAGPKVISAIDAREAEKGEELHPLFKVVVGDETVMGLEELDSLIHRIKESDDHMHTDRSAKPNYFLVSKPGGSFETDSSFFKYRVIEDSGDEQLIELIEEYKDGDNTIRSQYRAQKALITPLSTQMYYFGYIFNAIPYVIGGSLCLFIIGRVLLFVLKAPAAPNKPS